MEIINEIILPTDFKRIQELNLKNKRILKMYFDSDLDEVGKDFLENVEVKHAVFSQKVNVIPDNLLKNHVELECVEFDDGIKAIAEGSFYGCGLKDIIIPNSIEKIGDRAFACNPIKSVVIPLNVKEIGYCVFSDVPNITVFDSIEPEGSYSKKQSAYGGDGAKIGWIGLYNKENYTFWPGTPNSVWKDYELTVISAESREVLYKIWMCGEKEVQETRNVLVLSWQGNARFPLKRIDALFDKYKSVLGKVKTAVFRLQYPVDLSETDREKYIKYLKRMKKRIISEDFFEDNSEEMLFIKNENVV